jgi:hypothetical protein
MIRYCDNERFAKKLVNRPPEYIEEFKKLIVSRTDNGFYVDDENPEYVRLMQKYAPARMDEEKKIAICRNCHEIRSCGNIGCVSCGGQIEVNIQVPCKLGKW